MRFSAEYLGKELEGNRQELFEVKEQEIQQK